MRKPAGRPPQRTCRSLTAFQTPCFQVSRDQETARIELVVCPGRSVFIDLADWAGVSSFRILPSAGPLIDAWQAKELAGVKAEDHGNPRRTAAQVRRLMESGEPLRLSGLRQIPLCRRIYPIYIPSEDGRVATTVRWVGKGGYRTIQGRSDPGKRALLLSGLPSEIWEKHIELLSPDGSPLSSPLQRRAYDLRNAHHAMLGLLSGDKQLLSDVQQDFHTGWGRIALSFWTRREGARCEAPSWLDARTLGKAINSPLLFGVSAQGLRDQLANGLGADPGTPWVAKLRNHWWGTYPQARDLRDCVIGVIAQAQGTSAAYLSLPLMRGKKDPQRLGPSWPVGVLRGDGLQAKERHYRARVDASRSGSLLRPGASWQSRREKMQRNVYSSIFRGLESAVIYGVNAELAAGRRRGEPLRARVK